MWMVQKTIIIIEQGYINIGFDDDDDDGGCGESFFFTLLSSKENRTKNPTQDIFYMVNARYILRILLLVVFFAFYQVTSSNLRWTECKMEYKLMMISHHLLV